MSAAYGPFAASHSSRARNLEALSGLVEVGGGVLMVLGVSIATKTAISTSLAVVLSAGVVGALGYIVVGAMNLAALPPLIVGAMAGAWLGVRLRDPLPANCSEWASPVSWL